MIPRWFPELIANYPQSKFSFQLDGPEVLHILRVKEHVSNNCSSSVDLGGIPRQYHPLHNHVHRITLGKSSCHDGYRLWDAGKLVDFVD